MRAHLARLGLAATAAAAITFAVGFFLWPATITVQGYSYALAWSLPATRECIARYAFSVLAPSSWDVCARFLEAGGGLAGFRGRIDVVLIALACAAACLGTTWITRSTSTERVIRGRQLCGADALRKALAKECAQLGDGLEILPGIKISRDRESRHFLVWGSSGGGKTQALLRLLLPAIARGDRVIALDIKGDLTAGLPGGRSPPALIAPHDARSQVWDLAADVRLVEEAEELATRLIPVSDKDPMWGQAAGAVFVACVASLQQRCGTEWTWHDLHDLVTSDVRRLYDLADEFYPDARRLLEDAESRTTSSILINLQTHMRIVRSLAVAWGDYKGRRRFSVRDWIMNDGGSHQVVILQRSAQFPALSAAWIGAMVSAAAAALGDPALRESRRRRIWLALDEFPQLPRLNDFAAFLELGRSKGFCVALGVQDVAQLRKTYGANLADAWLGIIGTQVVCRINPGPAAEEASRLIGQQEVERPQVTTQPAGAGAARSSVTMHRDRRAVITPDEIASTLGPQRRGVRVVILGPGADVYRADLPYTTLPARRAPSKPAGWTLVDDLEQLTSVEPERSTRSQQREREHERG